MEQVCKLINKPRTKKEAKMYYKIDAQDANYDNNNSEEVSETEIQNIISYFKKLNNDTAKYADAFNNIASQYSDEQLKIIINCLPVKVKAVLEDDCKKYQELVTVNGMVQRVNREGAINQEARKQTGIKIDILDNKLNSQKMSGPIVIPASVRTSKNKGPVPVRPMGNSIEIPKTDKKEPVKTKKIVKRSELNAMGITDPADIKKVARQMGMQNSPKQEVKNVEKTEEVPAAVVEEKEAQKQKRVRTSAELVKIPPVSGNSQKQDEKRGRGRPKKIKEEPKVEEEDEFLLPGMMDFEEENVENVVEESFEIGEDMLPGLDEEDEVLPGIEEDEEVVEEDDEFLPGMEEDEEVIEEDDEFLPGMEEDEEIIEEDDEFVPGLDDDFEDDTLSGMLDDFEDDFIQAPETEEFEEVDVTSETETVNEVDEIDDFEEVEEIEEEYTEEVSLPELDELDDFEEVEVEEEVEEIPESIDEILPGMDEDVEIVEDELLPGFDEEDILSPDIEENVVGESQIESIRPRVDYSMSNLNSLLTKDKKIVAFLGTSKNGTSFLVNNLAALFSLSGINTAILDMTKNKNSYYIYTNNEEELRKIAYNSISKLQSGGYAEGIKVNKSLSVYTALPNDGKDYSDAEPILSTLVQNHSLILIDCDFDTDPSYFASCQEIYLVQSMDILTIQPLTAFLRDLKSKGVLESEKVRVVINKVLKVKSLTEKAIIGGMSFYNDPSMSFMTELFNKDMVKACSIPFDENVYAKYLDGIVNCKVSVNGYEKSKKFWEKFKTLGDMVYPLVSKPTYGGKSTQVGQVDYSKNKFSNNMNNTLNQMKKKY